ncbi:MAG TPA: 50S ribosomal protein L9 [Acidimicrobiia bacterium]|nr:50S ribosomal protein L9 [Acidimicrobiia bacterium]
MRLVLRTDVDNVGKKGELVDVADGYARNFLVPRGLAIVATKGAVKQADTMRRSREVKEAREREAIEGLAGSLRGQTIRVSARAGEAGKLFGSVTAAEIADAVQAQLGVDLDRRKLHLPEPIREVGSHEVAMHLYEGVEAEFTVVVEAQV